MKAITLMPLNAESGDRGQIMPSDFRKLVAASLERIGKSQYWLTQQVEGKLSRQAIYSYLAGESDMRGEKISMLLDVIEEEEKKQQRLKIKTKPRRL